MPLPGFWEPHQPPSGPPRPPGGSLGCAVPQQGLCGLVAGQGAAVLLLWGRWHGGAALSLAAVCV